MPPQNMPEPKARPLPSFSSSELPPSVDRALRPTSKRAASSIISPPTHAPPQKPHPLRGSGFTPDIQACGIIYHLAPNARSAKKPHPLRGSGFTPDIPVCGIIYHLAPNARPATKPHPPRGSGFTPDIPDIPCLSVLYPLASPSPPPPSPLYATIEEPLVPTFRGHRDPPASHRDR